MSYDQTRRVLRQHVKTDQLLGVDAVPVGEPTEASHHRSSSSDAAQEASTHIRNPLTTPNPDAASPATGSLTSDPSSEAGPSYPKPLDRPSKLTILQAMDEQEVRGCLKCGLCEGRTQTVFGEGDADARLMFVGEGPGFKEDQQGRPFVGPAGQMLDKQIIAMGLTREQVYIANVVKCRPPNNRAPTPIEAQTCGDYLRRQIQTIQPRVLVALGGPATKLLLNTKTGITALRGTWHRYEGLMPDGPPVPVMPTFHPAYLLRAYTPDNRRKVWSDLQQVMERLTE